MNRPIVSHMMVCWKRYLKCSLENVCLQLELGVWVDRAGGSCGSSGSCRFSAGLDSCLSSCGCGKELVLLQLPQLALPLASIAEKRSRRIRLCNLNSWMCQRLCTGVKSISKRELCKQFYT